MLNILVVEDDQSKREAITRVIRNVEELPADALIDCVSTAAEARSALSRSRYDAVVLDIALPQYHDSDVDPGAGMAILDDIVGRDNFYYTPTHIIGLTGYPDVLENARGRFASHLLTLAFYDATSTGWEEALTSRIRHIIKALMAVVEAEAEQRSDLAVVCALQMELSAVLAIPWQWKQIAMHGDHTIYWKGSYCKGSQQQVVYAGLAARMGMPAAASVASKMINWFKPRYIGMTGITSGIKGRVKLGDVIGADPCWDWGSGKWTLSGATPKFAAAPHQIGMSPWVRERLRLLAVNMDWLAPELSSWPGPPLTDRVQLHMGPLASGSAVLSDGVTAQRVIQQHRQLLGIEMESYGVYAAADESAAPRPQAFALKSVVDFADGEKDDRFQAFGAYISARVLRHFAERYL